MKTTVRRRALLVVLLVISAACGNGSPTSPSRFAFTTLGRSPAPPTVPPVLPAPPPPTFPPATGPSRTFAFARQLSYDVHDYTRNSQFVLYDNGAFTLVYPEFLYAGGYSDANGILAFNFGGGPADAAGTLTGESLIVEFSEKMQHSDFENAIYVLRR